MYHGCNWYILLGVCLWYIFSFFYVVFYTANFSSYNYNPKCWTSRFYSFATTDVWAFLVPQTVKNWPTMQETWFYSWFGKIPWRRVWQPTPVLLPGESQGQRNLADYIVHRVRKSQTLTDWLTLNYRCYNKCLCTCIFSSDWWIIFIAESLRISSWNWRLESLMTLALYSLVSSSSGQTYLNCSG